jgi:hypothetical protein
MKLLSKLDIFEIQNELFCESEMKLSAWLRL